MTDLASLALKMDSTEVKTGVAELDKLTAAGERTEQAVGDVGKASATAAKDVRTASQAAADLAREVQAAAAGGSAYAKAYVAADAAIEQLARAQAQATREIAAAKAAYKAGETSLEQYNAAVLRTKGALSQVEAEHRNAMTALRKTTPPLDEANDNLGKFSKTSNAAAFASRNLTYQLSDMAQGLALGAPPLQVLMQQLPQAADAFAMLAKESGGVGAAAAGIASKFGPLIVAVGAGAAAMYGLLETVNADSKSKLDAYAASLGLTAEQIKEAGGAAVTVTDLFGALWDKIKEALEIEDLLSDLKGWFLDTFKAVAQDAKKNISEIYAAIYTIDDALKYVGGHAGPLLGEGIIAAANAAISAVESLVNKAIDGLNLLMVAANPILALAKMAGLPVGMKHIDLGRIENQYAGAGAAAAAAFSASYAKHLKTAQDWISDTYADVVDGAVKKAQGRLDGAAEKAGKRAGAKGGKAAADEFAKELTKALDRLAEDVDDAFLKIIMDGRKAMADRAKAEWSSMMEDIEKAQAARVKPIEDAAEAQAKWNEQLHRTVDLLNQIGGFSGTIGRIGSVLLGLQSGDFSRVPGRFGASLDLLNQSSGGKEFLQRLGVKMDGFLGKFGTSVNGLVDGLGTFGLAVSANRMIGDIFGFKGGPLGIFTDLFTGTKKGRATFSGNSFSTSGNSTKREGAASDLAGSVLDALKQIGEAFDATVGTFDGTIGVRKNSIRYNASGTSLKQGANFGQDSAAAIAAAISDAISDGVFTGLSDGVERLLKSGGDLETQLQKALSFQGVFDELKQMKDPQGAALDDLTKWHDNMAAIFAEAGATSDQLAQLEELTGLKRQEIVEKYADAITSAEDIANQKRQLEIQIMQLEGKTVEALAAARQMEKAAADASLGALYDHIYALQDQASAAAAAAQAADRMANLQIRLAQAQGNDDLVTALQKQQELAGAASDAERDLINQIYAAEAASKAAAAAEAQRQKEQAEAEEIARQRQGLMLELLRAQGKAEEALAMERQAQLLTLDQSLRALQQQVWAEQDLAQKREDAAKVVENARNALSQSYQKEAQAIQQTIDKFKGFSDTLRDLRESLFSGTGFDDLASLQRKYNLAFTGALGGDVKGFEALPAALNAYRDAAITQAGSAAEARMITARLAQDLTRAIGSADDAADYQQLSLDALNQSVDSLIDIKEEVASVREAIADLKDALAEQTALQEQVGKTQIRAQQETNRTLRDATDGGYAMKTQAVS